MTKFYRVLGVTALLFCSDILAQGVGVSGPNVSRGNLLRKPEYQTDSALSLFVDPTGNDNNACTATGVDACLTFQGATNKIPKLVRHPVTVTSANGSYGAFLVSGFQFDPVSTTAGAYIWYQGAFITATVATGTATGTATAGSAGSAAAGTFGTMTDGTQAWTVDNLKGFILNITGGTGAGQQRVIRGNTATVITIVGTWTTAPAAGSTYTIQDWGTVISSSMTQSALPNVAAGTAAAIQVYDNRITRQAPAASQTATVYFDKIKSSPGAALGFVAQGGYQQIGINQCRFEGSSGGFLTGNGTAFRYTTSYATSIASAAILGTTGGGGAAHSINNSLFETSGASTSALLFSGAGTVSGNEFKTTGATSLAAMNVSFGAVLGVQANGNHFECAVGSTTRGLRYAEGFSGASNMVFSGSGNVFNNCATGVELLGNGRVVIGAGADVWRFNSLTNGIIARYGATFVLGGTADVFTTVTNEIVIDGTTYTNAVIRALSPPVVMSLGYGSWVGAQ